VLIPTNEGMMRRNLGAAVVGASTVGGVGRGKGASTSVGVLLFEAKVVGMTSGVWLFDANVVVMTCIESEAQSVIPPLATKYSRTDPITIDMVRNRRRTKTFLRSAPVGVEALNSGNKLTFCLCWTIIHWASLQHMVDYKNLIPNAKNDWLYEMKLTSGDLGESVTEGEPGEGASMKFCRVMCD
jgi:hypothetical protein